MTNFAASPIAGIAGLLVDVSYIVFTDRTWNNDFHFLDDALWFRDPFRGPSTNAMTTGAVKHYEDEEIYSDVTIKHELTHRRQFALIGDGFVPVYFAENWYPYVVRAN